MRYSKSYILWIGIFLYTVVSSIIFAYSVSPRPIKDSMYYMLIQGIFIAFSYFAIQKRYIATVLPYIFGYILLGITIIYNFPILYTEALRLVLFLWCMITVGILCIDIGIRSYFANRYIEELLFCVLSFFLFLPLSILSYNSIFKEYISTETFLPILQSDFIESVGFLYGNIPYRYYALSIGFLLVLYILQKKYNSPYKLSKKVSSSFLFCGVLILSVVLLTRAVQRLEPIALTFQDAYQTYYVKPAEYIMAREKNIQNAGIQEYNGTGLYIVIVGESAIRDSMSVYGYYRDTTPFLSAKKDSSQYIIMNNVYSSYIQTEDALMYALSSMSQYNGVAYNEAISLIDVLNTAGIHTIWLSGQGRSRGDANIKVRSFSQFAKKEIFSTTHSRWVSDDTELLPLLEEILITYKKNPKATVLFIHLYGSHGPFCAGKSRKRSSYFSDIPKIKKGNASINSINCYDNSIRITDEFLRTVTAMVEKEEDFKVLLYFSDHGEGVYRGAGRSMGQFDFDLVRVPMYIYASNSYMEQHKERIKILRNNMNRGFTTDMVYDTVLGTIGVQTKTYSAQQDIGSRYYSFTKENLKTAKGTKRIDNDTLWGMPAV